MIFIIIFRIFIFIFAIFTLITLVSGFLLWLKAKKYLNNPFQQPESPKNTKDDKIIEGEFTVIDEKKKD